MLRGFFRGYRICGLGFRVSEKKVYHFGGPGKQDYHFGGGNYHAWYCSGKFYHGRRMELPYIMPRRIIV